MCEKWVMLILPPVAGPLIVAIFTYFFVWRLKLDNEAKTKKGLKSKATIDQARRLTEITRTPEIIEAGRNKATRIKQISGNFQAKAGMTGSDKEFFYRVQDDTQNLLTELEFTNNLMKEDIISQELLKSLLGRGFLSLYENLLKHVIDIRRKSGAHKEVWKGVVELMDTFDES